MMQHFERFATALVMVAVVLTTCNAWSGTVVTRNFPDLEQHVRMFLDLPLGISQREFRARVPAAWRQLPIYPGYIHNQNLRGEIRPGYFEYRFVARGAEYPRTEFNFWEGKLVDALFISNGDNTEKRAHRAAAVRAAKILTRRYGRSEDSDMYRDLIWVHWRRGDVLARVSWHGRLTPNFSTYRSEFGISWEIYPKSMDWSGWRNRMPDTEGESETMAWITCQRKPEIPGDFSIQPGAFVFMPVCQKDTSVGSRCKKLF